jgi:hypothetical protein
MIKGRDLTLHLAQHAEPSDPSDDEENALSTLFYIEGQNLDLTEHPWYKDLIHYLQFQKCHDYLDSHQCRRLRLEASKYMILGNSLFQRFVDGLLLRCIDDNATQNILNEIHGSTRSNVHIGGHFAAKSTAFKILRIGYYWPFIFRDSFRFTRACDKCQKFVGKEHFSTMPLQPVLPDFPFSKWGLDFIGPINIPSSIGHIYILTTTYYFTKWVEFVPLKHAQDEHVIFFLESNIFSRFGLPLEIISDNGPTFISAKFTQFLSKFGVKHFTSSTYYPHGNVKDESTNKNLVKILKKIIDDKPCQWHTLLTYALWADQTTTKSSTGHTPFQLLYGQEAIML